MFASSCAVGDEHAACHTVPRTLHSQDDIRNVLKEGRLLLSNLETVKASKRDTEDEGDIMADMDTVHR